MATFEPHVPYVKIGTVDREGVYVRVKLTTDLDGSERLSITADIRRSGHCVGGGQSIDTVEAVLRRGKLAKGITPTTVEALLGIWRRWHLNDMNAGCEHQRDFGWRFDTHRGKACPICGYVIGTEWKHEALPEYVREFAHSFETLA